jgi:16S rRNA (uracil1498-N3)-methyltransferase
MARFYINKEQISEGKVIIQGKDVNHIKNVLRMKVQDSLELCDNENTLYNGRIAGFHPNFIEVFIDTVSENQTEPDIKLTVLQCIPKGDKMSTIIQKCVELGVSEIIPVLSHRCVSRPENKKVIRWNAVSEEAAKQCKRGIIPRVTDIMSFQEAVDAADADLKIICYELENERTLHDIDFSNEKIKTVAVIVGPEGGLEEKEVEYACNKQFFPVSLGKRILRTETVAPTVAGIIMYCMKQI